MESRRVFKISGGTTPSQRAILLRSFWMALQYLTVIVWKDSLYTREPDQHKTNAIFNFSYYARANVPVHLPLL